MRWCANLARPVIHEFGIPRDLINIALQVTSFHVRRLEAPVKTLVLALVVADEVQLLIRRDGRLRFHPIGRRVNLLPGSLGAVWLVRADVCVGRSVGNP